jgi:cytochrome c oxidase cbb3-type subunit 3
MTPTDRPGPGDPAEPRAEAAPDEPLFEHAYDGIQEYDNPMPGWWVLVFWATILFSAVYVLNVVPGVGPGKGWLARYAAEMAAAEKKYAALRAPQATPPDEVLRALAADPATTPAGRSVYMANCMPCHRADAGGVIGPNLTDDYWIHGGRPGDIHRVIAGGVLDKGMPAWSAVLAPDDVNRVAAYVIAMHGTNPPQPKEPQGVKVEDDAEDDSDGKPHDHAAHEGGSGDAAKEGSR